MLPPRAGIRDEVEPSPGLLVDDEGRLGAGGKDRVCDVPDPDDFIESAGVGRGL